MAFLIDGVNEAASPVMTFIPIILMLLSGYGIAKIISIVRDLRNNDNKSRSDSIKGNNDSKTSNVITIIKSNFLRNVSDSSFSLKDLICGSIILNFLFISGFILFGLLVYAAKEYFSAFTIILVILSTVGFYYLVLLPLLILIRRRRKKSLTVDSSKESSSYSAAASTNTTDDEANKMLSSSSFTFNAIVNIINNKNNNLLLILFGIALLSTLVVYHGIIIYYHPIFNEYDSLYLFLPLSKSILLGNGLNHDYYLGNDISVRYPPFVQAINAWLIYSFEYSSLRMFPVYFVILGSLAVYFFARNITKDSFLGLIASAAFLITPALLVVSSRFSLQLDLSFIFVLSATFYLLSEIVRHDDDNNYNKKPAKIYFLMLIACLSLLPLVREIGLVVSLAILFLVPAIKFTRGNIKLRALFSVLSFLPFYALSFYEVFPFTFDFFEISNGFTNTITIKLITLIIANIAVFYLLTKVNKNQNQFASLINIRTIKYLIPFVIPLIFISSNMLMFKGLYPAFVFAEQFLVSGNFYETFFGFQSSLDLDLSQAIQKYLLRLDILFISTAMGSIFLFFKLHGFGRLLYFGLKNSIKKDNYQYVLMLILLIFLLVTWSYLLASDFEGSGIRHIAYFVPLVSVILVVGMNARKKLPSAIPLSLLSQKQLHYKLFIYGIIVLATFYFLSYSLYTWKYDNHFGGFWIEPSKSSFMTLPDLGIAAFLFGALIIFGFQEQKISLWLKKYNLQRYLAFGFMALLAVQIYVLSLSLSSSGRILMAPIEKIDQVPPSKWEQNVFEVINCLNMAESGNVLSFRAPAIPFFTNRANYDLYSFETFSSFILPLLAQTENSTSLKQAISHRGINYIVLPNEKNSFYYLLENAMKQYELISIINSDSEFEKHEFEQFDLYKYTPNSSSTAINLIDEKNVWKPLNFAKIMHNDSNLSIKVNINNNTLTEKVYNRAVLQTQINMTLHPLLLDLDYTSQSLSGNAIFYGEIIDNDGKKMWDSTLTNTNGKLADETFNLPNTIVDKPIEFKLYVITDGTGEHILTVRKAAITYNSC